MPRPYVDFTGPLPVKRLLQNIHGLKTQIHDGPATVQSLRRAKRPIKSLERGVQLLRVSFSPTCRWRKPFYTV